MGAQPQYRDRVQPEIVAIDILSFGEAPPTPSPLEPSPTLAQPSRSYPEELTAFEICECPPDEAWVLDPQYRG